MITLHQKLDRLRQRGKVNAALLSVPTPVLLDGKGTPYSPVRTNYFPHAQVLLATETKQEMERQGVEGSVQVVDLKSLARPSDWRSQLHAYGELRYGDVKLTKYFIGNGMERCGELAGVDVVGITSNFTSEANSARAVIERTRQVNPEAIIVVGGMDASARPGFYRRIGADRVAIGDSDASFPEWVCNLVRDAPTRMNLDGTIAPKTFGSLPLPDLSLLPNLHRYKESGGGGFLGESGQQPIAAYMETSRGCDRECDFCTSRLTRRRNFSLEEVKAAARHYKSSGIRTLLFSDDNLLEWLNQPDGEENLLRLFGFLQQEDMIWEFSVGLELGRLLDKEGKLRRQLLEAMFWNNDDPQNWKGVFRMLAPFENIGQEMQLYRKMQPWEQNEAVMEAILEQGVPQINMGVMFGWPQDDETNVQLIRSRMGSIRRTVDNINSSSARQIKPGINLSLFCLMPLPGTPLFGQMEQEGRIAYSIEEQPELWNVFTSVIRGDRFQPERITEIRRELIAEFSSAQPEGKVRPQWEHNKG